VSSAPSWSTSCWRWHGAQPQRSGRHEKPVDRTVPARAELAEFLRGRKAGAGLTYEDVSKRVNGGSGAFWT
jgi:hypothetical protein